MMVPIMSTVFWNFFYFFIFREFLLRICILSSRLKLNIRETRRMILASRLRTACAQTYCIVTTIRYLHSYKYSFYRLQILLLIIHLSEHPVNTLPINRTADITNPIHAVFLYFLLFLIRFSFLFSNGNPSVITYLFPETAYFHPAD
jgi:hypothetical protein